MTLFETIKPFSPEGILFKLCNTTRAMIPTATIKIIITTTTVNLNGSVFIVISVFSCFALFKCLAVFF